MKYYSENLEKVFDSVDELNKAEHEAKTKCERKRELERELDALAKKMDELEKEYDNLSKARDKKYQEYTKELTTAAATSKAGHITVSKNGKVFMDEDATLDDSLFGLSRLLKSLY